MDVSVKETIRKSLNSSKLASRTHKMFIVNIDEEKFYALNKNITYLRTVTAWLFQNVMKFGNAT